MIGTQFYGTGWALSSAAALQQPDSASFDSVVVKSPLPGPAAGIVRFLLNTVPPWVQIGGVILAVIVAWLLLWFLFVRRSSIHGWLASRTRPLLLAIAAVTLLIIAGVGIAGASVWNYTQHSNEFCTGCHVMDKAIDRMASGRSAHSKISCHSCHQQSLFASARQLYVWVAERPDKIESHAIVPNRRCEVCHITEDTAVWQRIAATAGHRVHLESDSASLRNLQCTKCHGTEVHRFQPVKQTCGMSGCHDASKTKITLGEMAGQTVRHCTVCHQFTAIVPALATTDSARNTLVPDAPKCLGCHQMQKVLPDFDAKKDPHGGKCGTCHNPHTQQTASAAANSCATSGCHANWKDEPFHVGAAHKRVGSQCLTCHLPHAARVDASNCQGCHMSVRRGGKLMPPLPFDTTRALQRSDASPPRASGHALVVASSQDVRPASPKLDRSVFLSRHDLAAFAPVDPVPKKIAESVIPRPTRAAPFPHARHAKIACLVCHQTGSGHGLLTFEPPRGCQICHHQAPARAQCATCHEKAEYQSPKQATVTVTVAGHAPKPRPVYFMHAIHESRRCVECHTTPVTLAPAPSKAACVDCHENHHAAGRNCSSCHTLTETKSAHKLESAHQRCDACHTQGTVALLTPTRSFCSTCHSTKARGHYEMKECTVCHFLTEPARYRTQLVASGK